MRSRPTAESPATFTTSSEGVRIGPFPNSGRQRPLVPITAAQRAKCEKFADQLKRQVPCPDLLVWNDSGITCEVSFHGHSQVNIELDIAVADATELAFPPKR